MVMHTLYEFGYRKWDPDYPPVPLLCNEEEIQTSVDMDFEEPRDEV